MSDVRSFRRDEACVPQRPGTWSRRHGLVLFVCPLCGKGFEVLQTVLVDGTLDRPLSCPGQHCDFEGTVRFEGWTA